MLSFFLSFYLQSMSLILSFFCLLYQHKIFLLSFSLLLVVLQSTRRLDFIIKKKIKFWKIERFSPIFIIFFTLIKTKLVGLSFTLLCLLFWLLILGRYDKRNIVIDFRHCCDESGDRHNKSGSCNLKVCIQI